MCWWFVARLLYRIFAGWSYQALLLIAFKTYGQLVGLLYPSVGTWPERRYWLQSHHLFLRKMLGTRCYDRKIRAACAQSFALWQQATIEIMPRNYSSRTLVVTFSRSHANIGRAYTPRSLCYCLFAPHIYGVFLRAHSVRGELRVPEQHQWSGCNTGIDLQGPDFSDSRDPITIFSDSRELIFNSRDLNRAPKTP